MTSKRQAESQADSAHAARRFRRATKRLAWEDVDTQEDGNTSPLPPTLLREGVFSFFAPLPGEGHNLLYRFDTKQPKAALHPQRLVCKQWFKLAQWFESEASKRVLTVSMRSNESVSRDTTRHQRTGSDVVQLGAVCFPFILIQPTTCLRFFQCFPNVVRLHLAPESAMFYVILDAASRACPHVKVLALSSVRINYDVEAFTAALRAWYHSNGGLRALAIPFWKTTQDLVTFLVTTVAETCPQLELLLDIEE